jgi:hypothetical protein
MYITEQHVVFLLKDLIYPLKEQVTALFYSNNLTPVMSFMYYYARIIDKVMHFYETTRNVNIFIPVYADSIHTFATFIYGQQQRHKRAVFHINPYPANVENMVSS